MSKMRTETDSLGAVQVPAEAYWGAQTQRCIENFPIGRDRFLWGRPVIRAFGLLKKAAAMANEELEGLTPERAKAIIKAADEVIEGKLDSNFPLVVFQTGSGTQTNMNANEVIANRANELLGAPLGGKSPVHPNDHVNLCQSSNDAFPTAMHIAVVEELYNRLFPAGEKLFKTLTAKAQEYRHIVKTGRTHLQDATPLTVGQEIGAWAAQLHFGIKALGSALPGLYDLAVGGTAVGTGLNAHPRFGEKTARHIAKLTGHPFRTAHNKFFALAAHDALVQCSAALRTLAGGLMKMANDIRWLAGGPRCGIGELLLPENEPGSSIMPGKINPTQCEALTMVCVRVYGNDAAVAFAGSQGNFQLNVYKPIILQAVLESIHLLADAVQSFNIRCLEGLRPDTGVIAEHLENNLMLVTALSPHIGYDKSAEIARKAYKEKKSLRAAALELGYVSDEEFNRWVIPLDMTHPEEEGAEK